MGSKLSNQPLPQYDCSQCNIRVEPSSKNPMKCGLKNKDSSENGSERRLCCLCTNADLGTKTSVVECLQCKNKYNMPLRALGKKANELLRSIHDKLFEESGDREGKEVLMAVMRNALEARAREMTPEKSRKTVKEKFIENVKNTTAVSPSLLALGSPGDSVKDGSPGLSTGKVRERVGGRKYSNSKSPGKSFSGLLKRQSSESSKDKQKQSPSSINKRNEFAIDDVDDSDREAEIKNPAVEELEIASTLRGKRLSMKMENSEKPETSRRGKRPKVSKTPEKIISMIGTKVRKGFLVKNRMQEFTGKVVSYDAAAKLYMIQYEDGDSEEFTSKELQRYRI